MISHQAKRSLDEVFCKSAQLRLTAEESDACVVTPIDEATAAAIPEKLILVLTIASPVFRLLTLFHFDECAAMREYYLGEKVDRPFREVFGEIGNLCCGAMNHELGRVFPHLGMSTPYVLDGRSLAFLNTLNPAHRSHFSIAINDAVRMHATLCMCAYAPVDFSVDMESTEDTTGELELF